MLGTKAAIPFHKFVCPNCHNIPQGQQWMNSNETRRKSLTLYMPNYSLLHLRFLNHPHVSSKFSIPVMKQLGFEHLLFEFYLLLCSDSPHF